MKPTILIDCDGVLADFCEGFLDAIEEETRHRFGQAAITDWSITRSPFFVQLARDIQVKAYEDRLAAGDDSKEEQTDGAELAKKVWKRVNRIGWCAALPPIAGAKEAVAALREIGEVEVVTSPLGSSPTWMPERVEWLGRHFGFDSSDVHFVSKKFRVHGHMLVDDKPSHLAEWMRSTHVDVAGGTALLWDRPYNQLPEEIEGVARVTSWREVIEAAKAI